MTPSAVELFRPPDDAEEAAAARGECYVCFEDGAPRSPCVCTDRYLHVACQTRQIASTELAACPVCRTPYANMRVVRTWRPTARARACLAWNALLLLTAAVFWACHPTWTRPLSVRLRDDRQPRLLTALQIAAELLLFGALGVRLGWDLLTYLLGQWRLLSRDVRVTA